MVYEPGRHRVSTFSIYLTFLIYPSTSQSLSRRQVVIMPALLGKVDLESSDGIVSWKHGKCEPIWEMPMQHCHGGQCVPRFSEETRNRDLHGASEAAKRSSNLWLDATRAHIAVFGRVGYEGQIAEPIRTGVYRHYRYISDWRPDLLSVCPYLTHRSHLFPSSTSTATQIQHRNHEPRRVSHEECQRRRRRAEES